MVSLASCSLANPVENPTSKVWRGWKTDLTKHSIDLGELMSGGPPKDGIPALDHPRFVSIPEAQAWLKPQEPVVSLVVGGVARAYPLQILIWHEIVNDRLGEVPVAVTFCPLCNSAMAFDRRIKTRELTFGTSGLLRHSDLVMYDRETESLWQQFTGGAIVGELTGTQLEILPAQIISFEQFASDYSQGRVLSRETGFQRAYGRNPYVGYDDITQKPFLFRHKLDDRLPPMERVITLSLNQIDRAYPYTVTGKLRVIHDEMGGQPIVVFHGSGAVSALDRSEISASRQAGSTGVFDPRVNGKKLEFQFVEGKFVDQQTQSVWTITGKSVEGPLKGKQLIPLVHGDYFAFAWFAFKPKTEVYRPK